MQLFPALLIGGPPHSGKSVLAYNLTQTFRQLGLEHYLLRACPDGEGDWANEIDQSRVRLLRIKGVWDVNWVKNICRDITRRHLPLLVDVGGRPEPWQEPIFSHCTHAVLIAQSTQQLAQWREYAHRYGVTILAEIESSLIQPARLYETSPIFRAMLSGLERGATQRGPVFEALVKKLRPYFSYARDEICHYHLNSAPVELALDLDQLAQMLKVPNRNKQFVWRPRNLPELLEQIPIGQPLALYGRGPNWLYAAVALAIQPSPFYQFDPRLGWIKPAKLEIVPTTPDPALSWEVRESSNHLEFRTRLNEAYLDYREAEGLRIPVAGSNEVLVLHGRLPLWLISALAIAYHRCSPVLAIYQPKVGNVVVASKSAEFSIGDILASA